MKGLIIMLATAIALQAQTPDHVWEFPNTKVNCIAVTKNGGRVLYSTDHDIFEIANGNRITDEGANAIQFFGDFLYCVTSDGRLVRRYLDGSFATQDSIEGIPKDETPQVPMSGLYFPWLWLNMGSGYRDNAIWNIWDGQRFYIGFESWHMERENCDMRGLVFYGNHYWSAEFANCQIHKYSNERPIRHIIETIEFPNESGHISAFWIGRGCLYVAFETFESDQYNTKICQYQIPVKPKEKKKDK